MFMHVFWGEVKDELSQFFKHFQLYHNHHSHIMDVIWGSVKCVLCHDSKMLILNLPIKSIAYN
jgi:hypothetical protein